MSRLQAFITLEGSSRLVEKLSDRPLASVRKAQRKRYETYWPNFIWRGTRFAQQKLFSKTLKPSPSGEVFLVGR